jgi:hypothetical protein
LERYVSKRTDQITTRTLSDVADAFSAAAAEVLGQPSDSDLSPKAQSYFDNFKPFVQQMFDQAKGRAVTEGEYILKSELPKYVEAEIAKRNRETEPLKRPEGVAQTVNTSSIEYWENRVAHQGEDGYAYLTDSDWNQYRAVRRANGL